jgi:hypothetical protein
MEREGGGEGEEMERKRIMQVKRTGRREGMTDILCGRLLDPALVIVDVLTEGGEDIDRISAGGWSTPLFRQRES